MITLPKLPTRTNTHKSLAILLGLGAGLLSTNVVLAQQITKPYVTCNVFLEYNHPPRTNLNVESATFEQFQPVSIEPLLIQTPASEGVTAQIFSLPLTTCRDAKLELSFVSRELFAPTGEPLFSGNVTYIFSMEHDKIFTKGTLTNHRTGQTAASESENGKIELTLLSEDPTSILRCEFFDVEGGPKTKNR